MPVSSCPKAVSTLIPTSARCRQKIAIRIVIRLQITGEFFEITNTQEPRSLFELEVIDDVVLAEIVVVTNSRIQLALGIQHICHIASPYPQSDLVSLQGHPAGFDGL